jgi:hypothetical protein
MFSAAAVHEFAGIDRGRRSRPIKAASSGGANFSLVLRLGGPLLLHLKSQISDVKFEGSASLSRTPSVGASSDRSARVHLRVNATTPELRIIPN